MAEIGLAASIVGLLTLAGQVTAISYKYFKGVENASRDVKELTNELASLSGILAALQTCLSMDGTLEFSAEDDGQNLRQTIETSLQQCASVMEELRSKLEIKPTNKRNFTKATAEIFRSLMWPLKEKETKEYVKKLDRFKVTFTLAISVESRATSTVISNKLTRIEKTITDVAISQDANDKAQEDTKKEKILNWISLLDHRSNHRQASESKTADTGQWFLKRREFQSWLDGADEAFRRLWLHGIPGAGKTILISTVIDHLKSSFIRNKRYGLAYFYFDFRDSLKQDTSGFLASITCQLLRLQPLSDEVIATYNRYNHEQPTLSDLKDLFGKAISALDKVYLVVDAMDECKHWNDLYDLVSLVSSKNYNVQFLASSRKEKHIEAVLRPGGFSCMAMEDEFVGEDITLHVRNIIAKDPIRRFRPSLKDEICAKLIVLSKGSFRWVECQIDSITSCRTEREIHSSLSSLPKSLNEIYERTINSIREEDKEIARRALLWLVLSKSPMTIQELAEAVKIEPRQFKLDGEDCLLYPEVLYSICPSLITERSDGKVGLAHYSVQEYLVSENAKEIRVDAVAGNAEIASVCLTYMLQEDLQRGPHSENVLWGLYEGDCSPFPLLAFASKNWFKHICDDQQVEQLVENLVVQFLLPKQSQPSIMWQKLLLEKSFEHLEHPPRLHFRLEFSVPVALRMAVCFNLPQTLENLLCNHDLPIDHFLERGVWNISPLNLAVELQYQNLVERLLQAGANPNIHGSREGLLYYSVHSCSFTITKLLLEYGADLGHNYKRQLIPVLARAYQRGFGLELAELFFGHKVCLKSRSRLLLSYIDHGEWDPMNILLDMGIKIPSGLAFRSIINHDHPDAFEILTALLNRNSHTGASLQPALSEAAQRGKNAFIHLLLRHGADVNACVTQTFEPPLVAAARNYRADTVRLLLLLGADPNIRGYNDETALQAAPSIETVRMLLDYGADVNHKSFTGVTALARVATYNGAHDEDIVAILLEAGANPDPQLELQYNLRTPIISAVKRRGERMVYSLLSRNVKLNEPQVDKYGSGTALIAASEILHLEIVQILLAHGADPNTHGGEMFSALHAAAGSLDCTEKMEDVPTVFQILLNAGADPHAQGGRYGTVLIAACCAGNQFAVDRLLALGVDMNVLITDGSTIYPQTALMSALSNDHLEIARFLISHGADLSVGAPLHALIASSNTDPEMVKFLLKHGARLNAVPLRSEPTETAIWGAVEWRGDISIIRVLLEAGADPNSRHPSSGPTLLDRAIEEERWDVVALLEEYGAKESSVDEA